MSFSFTTDLLRERPQRAPAVRDGGRLCRGNIPTLGLSSEVHRMLFPSQADRGMLTILSRLVSQVMVIARIPSLLYGQDLVHRPDRRKF